MNFWDVHGMFWGIPFLLVITFSPRLTMLFAVATPFGWLAWIGWFCTPSILVALLATHLYGDTNPFLVGIAWIFALCKVLSFLFKLAQLLLPSSRR